MGFFKNFVVVCEDRKWDFLKILLLSVKTENPEHISNGQHLILYPYLTEKKTPIILQSYFLEKL